MLSDFFYFFYFFRFLKTLVYLHDVYDIRGGYLAELYYQETVKYSEVFTKGWLEIDTCNFLTYLFAEDTASPPYPAQPGYPAQPAALANAVSQPTNVNVNNISMASPFVSANDWISLKVPPQKKDTWTIAIIFGGRWVGGGLLRLLWLQHPIATNSIDVQSIFSTLFLSQEMQFL